jgi:hypothetical protein
MVKRKTTEEFIIEAKELYGDKFDYSKVDYKNCRTKIIIICKKHGEFEQLPNNHLSGSGCWLCGIENQRKDPNLFLKEAKAIHNNKYIYDKVQYINDWTEIIIICPIHNKEFRQSPNTHLQGHGCPYCANNIQLTNEIFADKANYIHNYRYSYNYVDYKNNHTKVKIGCLIHGIFQQTPNAHLSGDGCPRCSNYARLDTELFIEKAKLIQPEGRYSYDNVCYIDHRTPIQITCLYHKKDFIQMPYLHLQGHGCQDCFANVKYTNETYIEKANILYNNLYCYDKLNYDNCNTPIIIICKKHGEFSRKAFVHLQGAGCPKCYEFSSRSSKIEEEWLISLNIPSLKKQWHICKTKYYADGYDPATNTIYEFNGDYWHGNPNIYKSENINLSVDKTYGELYRDTIKREEIIRTLGYNLVVMWESDWKILRKAA